jgi:hypothetical protein
MWFTLDSGAAGGEGLSVQQAIGSTPDGSQVRELLAVYQGVLDTVGDLPQVPMVLRRRGGRLHYLPRPRWLLRYFVIRHIDRTLADLSRRYSARTALGRAADDEQKTHDALREFQQSLPPTLRNTYAVLLILASVVVLYRPIINAVVPVAINLTQATTRGSELRQQVLETVEKVGAALTANFTSVSQAVNALLSGGALHLSIVTLGVAFALYVVLRPLVPAFRLKRMLFNLAPAPEWRHRSAVARWSVSQATGLYERERRVFAEVAGRPPTEVPFDLVVPGLAVALPLAFTGLIFRLAVITPLPGDRVALLTLGAVLLIPVLVRLGWLYRTWQRRRLGGSGPYMPFEVGIRGGSAVATVENQVGVRVLILCLFLVMIVGGNFGNADPKAPSVALSADLWFWCLAILVVSLLVGLPWWYRINRELRDLDCTYETSRASSQPLWSLLTMTVGWLVLLPPFIAVFQTCRRIQKAQARTGQPETLRFAWVLATGLFLPVLFSYMQHELNKVWTVEGEPLDPWGDDTSTEARCPTGDLPWHRGLTGQTHPTGA